MASVASRNLFAALGSDNEDEDPRPVKQSTTSKAKPEQAKAPAENSAAPRGARGGSERGGRGRGRGGRGRGAARGGYSNEDAFKDRDEVLKNRERDASENRPPRPRGGRGSSGGAGGAGGRGRQFDRHSATGRVDTQKATEQGWGHEATSWESAQPIAEADREEEKKEANEPTSAPEEAADGTVKEVEPEKEEEPEPMTYKEWLEQNKKKAEEAAANVRQPDQTQWEAAKELVSKKAREAKEALFGSESAQKTKTTTAASSKKTSGPKKVLVDIEQVFSPVRSERGGRGRGGARGTGERGGRGRGRGEGGRGRGGAAGRGGRGGSSQTINVADTEAFPALG